MPKEAITILTGSIRSGKTSYLKDNFLGKENIYGILSPIYNDKRQFLNLATKEIFPMEAGEAEKDVLLVGKYRFSKTGFEKARQVLLDGLKRESGVLILDEIGPLELRGEGFYAIIKQIVSDRNQNLKKILV